MLSVITIQHHLCGMMGSEALSPCFVISRVSVSLSPLFPFLLCIRLDKKGVARRGPAICCYLEAIWVTYGSVKPQSRRANIFLLPGGRTLHWMMTCALGFLGEESGLPPSALSLLCVCDRNLLQHKYWRRPRGRCLSAVFLRMQEKSSLKHGVFFLFLIF